MSDPTALPTINRTHWQFPFKRDDLRQAVAQKLQFHTERFRYWAIEVERLEREIREKGVVFTPELVDPRHGVANTYHQQQVAVDNGLTHQHYQAQQRKLHHDELLSAFARWTTAFGMEDAPSQYDLTIDDVAYFFHPPADE